MRSQIKKNKKTLKKQKNSLICQLDGQERNIIPQNIKLLVAYYIYGYIVN